MSESEILRPVAATSNGPLVAAVYESILEAIVSGRLPSGTILSEVSVARKLAVSRTPVHDALRQLGQDGLIERENHRRAKVARFNRDDIWEIFEMRKYLEGPAAELAAGRMDVRQLLPLRRGADELERDLGATDWVSRWVEYDDLFHKTIADASGNKRLASDINRYRLLHRGFNRMTTEAADLKDALAQHEQILSALESHDGERARQTMVAHISHWEEYFIRHFPR